MFSVATQALICNDLEHRLPQFSEATRMAMQLDAEIHRRKFGLGGQGAVDWPQIWAAIQALVPVLLAVVAGGSVNVTAIPAAIAAVVTVLIDLFTGVPIPAAPAPS